MGTIRVLAVGSLVHPQVKGAMLEEDRRGAVVAACRALGRELATRGHTLVVVSDSSGADDDSVSPGFLEGYLEVATGSSRSVEVHSVFGASGPLMDLANRHPEVVHLHPYHQSADTQVVQLTALRSIDAAVLVAGARGTKNAGFCAHLMGKAVVPVACFGGGAESVWLYASSNRPAFYRQAITDQEINDLYSPWNAEQDPRMTVWALERVSSAITRERTPREVWTGAILILILSLVGWVACLTIPSLIHGGVVDEESGVMVPYATPLLFLTVCCTGVFGSCIHTLRRVRSGEPTSSRLLAIDAILGLAVGVASTVVYLVAELGVTGKVETSKSIPDFGRMALLGSLIALFAGLYLDAAFERFDRMKHLFLAGRFREGPSDEK